MWVVEYRQYPSPAGLKPLSKDSFWRAVYDPPFPPPPPFTGDNAKFLGKDVISIHESTHGDGVFDKTTVFLDGLNLATAALRGRGGVFVMNPPYLLYYPCDERRRSSRRARQAAGTMLSGFGLEDTHSIANSLRFRGPDGWICGLRRAARSAAAVVRYDAVTASPCPAKSRCASWGRTSGAIILKPAGLKSSPRAAAILSALSSTAKANSFSITAAIPADFTTSRAATTPKLSTSTALSNPLCGATAGDGPINVDRCCHIRSLQKRVCCHSGTSENVAIAPHHYVVCTDIALPQSSTFRTHDLEQVITAGKQPGMTGLRRWISGWSGWRDVYRGLACGTGQSFSLGGGTDESGFWQDLSARGKGNAAHAII